MRVPLFLCRFSGFGTLLAPADRRGAKILQRFEDADALILHRGRHLRIDLQRLIHRFVAEPVLHVLRVRAGLQQHGGVRLPETVEVEADAERLDHADRVLHRVRPDEGAILAAADEVDPVIRITWALDQVPLLIDMVFGIVWAIDEAGAALHREGPLQQAEQLGADPDRADAVIFRSGEVHRLELCAPIACRRSSTATGFVLDLTIHGDRAGLEVDIFPAQAEDLTLPEAGPVTEHQRQVGRVALREALHDPLPGRAVDVAMRVPACRLIGHRTGRRQPCIPCGVVFNVLHADRPVHGSGQPALHVGECIAGKSLVK